MMFMNVVVGVFVSSAVRRASHFDQEQRHGVAEEIRLVMHTADGGIDDDTRDGKVSKDELTSFLASPFNTDKLASLGLEVPEVLAVFQLLAGNGKDGVDVDELSRGCARFTRPVRSVDIVPLLLNTKKVLYGMFA